MKESFLVLLALLFAFAKAGHFCVIILWQGLFLAMGTASKVELEFLLVKVKVIKRNVVQVVLLRQLIVPSSSGLLASAEVELFVVTVVSLQ
jgi:hypothetical protein